MLVPAKQDSQMAMFTNKNKPQFSESQAHEIDKLRRGILGNMSMIYIKQEKWDRVCKMNEDLLTNSAVLSLSSQGQEAEDPAAQPKVDFKNPENVKPMYRLALGKFRLGNSGAAENWLQKVLQIEPGNESVAFRLTKALSLLKELKYTQKADEDKLRARMSKMFSPGA